MPNSFATIGGGNASVFPFNLGIVPLPSQRYQQIYAASQFPAGPQVISQLAFRPTAGGGPFSLTISNIRLDLSTTTASPMTPSSTFADNVGADDTVVFSGALSLSSAYTGPPDAPKDFDIVINLQTTFVYDPTAGNLLLDVRNFSGENGGPNPYFDYYAAGTGDGSNIHTTPDAPLGVNSPFGFVLLTGLVTRFTTTPRCADPTIALPDKLPNQTTCTRNTKTPNPDCNGWMVVGPEFTGSTALASTNVDSSSARFYEWEPNPNPNETVCFYLYRVANDSSGTFQNTLNGVHCYNTTTCALCAFDYTTPPKTNPVWSDLLPASSGMIEDCSKCHAAGPVTPEHPFWRHVHETTRSVMWECAMHGGPRWVGAPATWAVQDNARNVPPPAKCSRPQCHPTGFVKGATSFCPAIVAYTFAKGGSMKGKFGSDRVACVAFATAMNCTPEQLSCPP